MLDTLDRGRQWPMALPRAPLTWHHDAQKKSSEAWSQVVIVTLCALGAGLRAWLWWYGPALWLDEAKLNINILGRDFFQLVKALDFEQVAAPTYLWLVKIATWVGGSGERPLRVVSLLSGIALLVLVARWTRALLPATAACWAVAMCALSPLLTHHCISAKHYELEAMASVWVALELTRIIRSPRRAVPLCCSTLFLAISSVTAPFVLVAAALALLLSKTPRRTVLLSCVPALLVYSMLYFTMYRPVSALPMMHDFWRVAILNGPAALWRGLDAGRDVLGNLWWGEPLAARWGMTSAVLWLLGMLCVLVQLRRGIGVFLVLTCILPVLASMAGFYPIIPRTVLFATPFLYVGAAVVLWTVSQWLPARLGLILASVACAWLVKTPALNTLRRVREAGPSSLHAVIASQRQSLNVSDVIYVGTRALPTWVYYTTDWSNVDKAWLSWITHIAAVHGPTYENADRRPGPIGEEGDELTYALGPARVLIGIPSGAMWRWGPGITDPTPDAGFADNELRRLRRSDAKRIWLFFQHDLESIGPLLQTAMQERLHATQQSTVAADEATLALYTLPHAP